MNKVLIIGPDFFNYNQSIERAFQNLEFETKVLGYSPGEVKSLTDKLKYYGTRDKSRFFEKVKKKFNNEILELYNCFRPDLVFIIQGNYVFKNTVEKIGCKKILWMMDSIFRAKGAYEIRNDVDHIFLFERTDIEKLWQSDRIQARFLPLALDETVYYPIQRQRMIDILFVGALYEKRVALLERIIKRFNDKHIRIYGRYYSPLKRPFYHVARRNKKHFFNRNLLPAEVNEMYNKSRICLNIHHDQSKYGVNQRFFEISGSRCFQLVDNNPFILDNFSNEEIAIYHSEEDLFKKIEAFLCDQETAISMAERAYKKVLEGHTFTHRIKEVLNTLGIG